MEHAPSEPADRPTRLVVGDDSYLVREAMEQLLGQASGIDVVAMCADGDELGTRSSGWGRTSS
jgi:hypothetical protein